MRENTKHLARRVVYRSLCIVLNDMNQENFDVSLNTSCHLCGVEHLARPWEVWCPACRRTASPGWRGTRWLLLMAGAVGVLLFGATITGVAVAVLLASLVAASHVDVNMRLLPDDLVLPLVWLGLLLGATGHGLVPLPQAVYGATIGYVALWLLYWAGGLATGEEVLGYGDLKLTAALGAWLGVAGVAVSLVVAACGLTLMTWGLRLFRRPPPTWPFGPFLAVGGTAALLAKHLGFALV